MPEINQNLQKEGKLYNKEFRKFKGVFTQASRNAIPEGYFYQLENLQPVGDANLHTILDKSASLFNYSVNTIYWADYANLNGVDFLFFFATNGNVYAFNTSTLVSQLISSALSGSGSRMTQWKNTQVLFIDSTGYYHYDGTTFAQITGTGVPTAGNEIAVYQGRVWIWEARLLTVGDADDYTAAAFLATNGAIAINLTDPTLRSTVVRAKAANGYLYFAGNSSINVISNVYIPSGASPPAPLLTNTNIQSTVGSDQPGSFFTPDDRDLFFANAYGVYRLSGVTSDRVSADIDGTWQYRDPSQQAFGGAVNSNNILHSCILMKRLNDPVFGSNTIIAMFANDNWWFVNYGSLTLIFQAIVNNQPTLYGFIGNNLYQLFSNSASSPVFTVSTALWPMEDALADKHVIRAGFEATVTTFFQSFSATIDTVNGSLPFQNSSSIGTVQWINNSSQVVIWENNSLATVNWFNGSYVLNWGSSPLAAAKYVGMTLTGQAIAEVSGFFMDYKFGARWGGGTQ